MKRSRVGLQVGTFMCLSAAASFGAALIWAPPSGMAESGTHKTDPAKIVLDLSAIKALEGTWVAIDEAGELTDDIVSIYRTTAGGSVVLETLFPDTDHEMLTIYHMDRGELVLTHYCVMGNEPRMKASRGEGGRQIVFECSDCDAPGTNITNPDDGHMHKGVMTFHSDDRISAQWFQHVDGGIGESVEFKLARRAKADQKSTDR